MDQAQLPTYEDVIRACMWEQNERKTSELEPSWNKIRQSMSSHVLNIWVSGSIPTVSIRRIEDMIQEIYDKPRALARSYKRDNGKPTFDKKIENFRNVIRKLFDIAACRCTCVNCKCPKDKKIPKQEIRFMKDQRNSRSMVIGGADKQLSNRNVKIYKRQLEKLRQTTAPSIPSSSTTTDKNIFDNIDESSSEENIDCDFEPSTSQCKQNRIKIPSLSLSCDRAGVSDRAGALIASSVLCDVGIIQKDDLSCVIDKNKLRRGKIAQRKVLQDQEKSSTETIRSIFFDGRKDETLCQVRRGTKMYTSTSPEEHYAILEEPNTKYLGHVTPAGSTAEDVSNALLKFLRTKNVDILAIGCDGTVVNTGHKNGVIAKIEQEYGKNIQWLICQLHANELPLRHLVIHKDGKTTGPNSFVGPIGKMLQNCEQLPIYNFMAISCDETFVGSTNLSTDQKYLAEIHEAVVLGFCPEDLAGRNPGNISHSRWLTTANRFMRLYISTNKPSDKLMSIMNYIVKVYVPTWFDVKRHCLAKDGAKNLHRLILRVDKLSDEESKNIVLSVIQRNGFFAHPENILLAMVSDDSEIIRRLGWRRILKIRESAQSNELVRAFRVPPINFQSNLYYEMIDWSKNVITEPPLFKNIPLQDIKEMASTGRSFEFGPLQKLPCHTQAVERHVKIITEASKHVCGNDARDGYIRSILKSRDEIPSFTSKKSFM